MYKILVAALLIFLAGASLVQANTTLPVPGTVTMIDLGAKSCIPCKMMAPVLEKLKAEYEGRAAVVFIDVWENPAEKANYSISAIPTQIFFNKAGEEVRRHVGFMDEDSIRKILDRLLAD